MSAGEPLAAQLTHGEGSLLAGDVGLITIKALLENGVGYLATGWIERTNPIDAAIADCQHGLLAPRGVLLRRLRQFRHVEQLVQSPGSGTIVGGDPMRGAVVWSGRTGMRPALERFCQLETPAPVIGFCFDPDILRSANAVVLDPEPNPRGLVRAVDQAFALSHATGRPVLVLLRERMLGMRGTLRCRDNIAAGDVGAFVAAIDTGQTPDAAIGQLGANLEAMVGDEPAPQLVVCGAALASAAVRATVAIDAACEAAGVGPACDGLAVLGLAAPTVVGAEALAELAAPDARVLILEDTQTAIGARLEAAGVGPGARTSVMLPYSATTGGDVVRAVAGWLAGLLAEDGDDGTDEFDVDARAALRSVLRRLAAAPQPEEAGLLEGRLPRRGAVLNRDIAPQIAAGLVLAQCDIGVPGRLDGTHPSYGTDTGVALTVTNANDFAALGAGVAAPAARSGVYVVTGAATGGVQAAAAAIGATVEPVPANAPRALGAAIARACASPRVQPHVIVTVPAIGRASGRPIGADHELLAGDQIARDTLPHEATTIAGSGSLLATGPVAHVRDPQALQGSIHQVAQVSPAWYDVVVRHRPEWLVRVGFGWKRRLVRSLGKLDL